MRVVQERLGSVSILTLSRPAARNAWCKEFNDEIPRLLHELEHDPEVRCVVLTGDEAGRAARAGQPVFSARDRGDNR